MPTMQCMWSTSKSAHGISCCKKIHPPHAWLPPCTLPPAPALMQAASGAQATGRQLPLAIMTSDDTHARTEALLKQHNYFGMQPSQVCFCSPSMIAARGLLRLHATCRGLCGRGCLSWCVHSYHD